MHKNVIRVYIDVHTQKKCQKTNYEDATWQSARDTLDQNANFAAAACDLVTRRPPLLLSSIREFFDA